MDYGFIKMHRKMLDWEWYNDINTKVLFLHLLLKANWEDKQWKGITIERGEILSSLEHLSKETGLTIQNIRTSISKLKSTGELTNKSTSKYTLFKLNNYDVYQGDQQANQQTANKQLTTTKELKELKEEKEINTISVDSEKIYIYWQMIKEKDSYWKTNRKLDDKILTILTKIVKKYSKEDIEIGIKNYLDEIKSRKKDEGTYYKHRFTLQEFFTNNKRFTKFYNLNN